jgi:hypothetical protein
MTAHAEATEAGKRYSQGHTKSEQQRLRGAMFAATIAIMIWAIAATTAAIGAVMRHVGIVIRTRWEKGNGNRMIGIDVQLQELIEGALRDRDNRDGDGGGGLVKWVA